MLETVLIIAVIAAGFLVITWAALLVLLPFRVNAIAQDMAAIRQTLETQTLLIAEQGSVK